MTSFLPRFASRFRTVLGLAIGLSAIFGPYAQSGSWPAGRVAGNPPEAVLRERNADGAIIRPTPPGLTGRTLPSEKFLNLRIDYTESRIRNPATGRADRVRLRTYKDANRPSGDTEAPPFVGPTIRAAPGDTIRVALENRLPSEPGCPTHGHVNTPHCFNSSNLHSHGLWISPMGNSDNVFLTVHPGVTFQYEYNIPADHAAGTFWYHPHLHGSTAVQVASGMAGVLIVEGNRKPGLKHTGDVDILLADSNGRPFADRILLLQQIPYACRGADGKIRKAADGTWVCSDDPGDSSDAAIGKVEPIDFDLFGQTKWGESGRHTGINGLILPDFSGAEAGRPERWRIAHAGVRATVSLQIRKMRTGARAPDGRAAPDPENRWLEENCIGENLPQFALASDGLTRERIAVRTTTVLQPGYREDLLLIFPEPGDYCIIDDSADDPRGTVNNTAESRKYLGRITVTGTAIEAGAKALEKVLLSHLETAAQRFLPQAVGEKVRRDLADGMRLSSFVKHKPFANEILGEQILEFDISDGKFRINGNDYDQRRTDRHLQLGSADRWILTSKEASHPFHIHVNPFQVESIVDPRGKEVDDATGDGDPEYANLKGVWRDTLFVKKGYTVKIRTRYERYVGNFVVHCHILDHEDRGMMQNVRIDLPDAPGRAIPLDPSPHGVVP